MSKHKDKEDAQRFRKLCSYISGNKAPTPEAEKAYDILIEEGKYQIDAFRAAIDLLPELP